MPTNIGKFNARFNLHNVDTATKKIFIDIEVQAHNEDTRFRISDMNWRFLVPNRNAIKPNSVKFDQGLTLHGYVPQTVDGQTYHSFYEPHSTTGSKDILVSYNVELGGQGYLLSTTEWTSVGRLSFDIEDTTETAEFVWNKRADFPPTFVGEICDNQLFAATEGTYENLRVCLGDYFPEDAKSEPTGRYDVRFALHEINAEDMTVAVDIELKADCEGNEFYVSEQNYRFSISNTNAINPQSVRIEELKLSGLVGTPLGNSFYGPHTTNGSLAHIISYNIELQGGPGYPLVFDEWTKIGRLTFDILDAAQSFELIWHKHETFPPCFIGEKFEGRLYEAQEADYENLVVDLAEEPVPAE